MAAEELRERHSGLPRLAVVQRDVERGKALHRDALTPDRGRGPQELLPEPADVEGILADEERPDLSRVGEQRRPAGALAVAEAEPLRPIRRGDAHDDHVDVAERPLPAGVHLRVAHRLGERHAVERAVDPRDHRGGPRRDRHGPKCTQENLPD